MYVYVYLSYFLCHQCYIFRMDNDIVISTYLAKFKEQLLSLVSSPSCYYSPSMECFLQLSPGLGYSVGEAELLTCPAQLQHLAEICGPEGMVWLTAQIEQDIFTAMAKLQQIVQVIHSSRCFSLLAIKHVADKF